jgi:hypothetical protein
VSVISAYVRQVAKDLPGPRGLRRDVLAELADGLHDAAHAYRRAGLSAHDAERRAVADAGPPADVAAAYRPELLAAQAGRTATLFALSMPALTLAWMLSWRLWPPAGAAMSPSEPSSRLVSLLSTLTDGFGILGALGGVAGLASVTWTARRRRPVRPVVVALVAVCGVAVASVVASSVAMNLLTPARALDMMAASTPVSLVGLATLIVVAWQVASLYRTARLVFRQG